MCWTNLQGVLDDVESDRRAPSRHIGRQWAIAFMFLDMFVATGLGEITGHFFRRHCGRSPRCFCLLLGSWPGERDRNSEEDGELGEKLRSRSEDPRVIDSQVNIHKTTPLVRTRGLGSLAETMGLEPTTWPNGRLLAMDLHGTKLTMTSAQSKQCTT